MLVVLLADQFQVLQQGLLGVGGQVVQVVLLVGDSEAGLHFKWVDG